MIVSQTNRYFVVCDSCITVYLYLLIDDNAECLHAGVCFTETELSMSGSSRHKTTQGTNGSQTPTLSRFYRSLSSSSDASDDGETSEVSKRSLSPVQQGSLNFYLEPSLSDDEAPRREAQTSVQPADSDVTKPHRSTSMEFGNLFNLMFSRGNPSCLPPDQPEHHGSLGSFALPKGSFGSLAVLPHVSSFG